MHKERVFTAGVLGLSVRNLGEVEALRVPCSKVVLKHDRLLAYVQLKHEDVLLYSIPVRSHPSLLETELAVYINTGTQVATVLLYNTSLLEPTEHLLDVTWSDIG